MENEIKINEYVRTKRGIIDKVDALYEMIENTVHLVNQKWFNTNNIVKHSPNLIDIIEVGDYVNESEVLDIMEDMKTGEVHLEMTMNYTNEELGDCTIYNKDIKTVVTKEIMESISYKVKQEEN